MRFRKLRIAFSATCSIACVLLIVLWVRSYQRTDKCSGHIGVPFFVFTSSRGEIGIGSLQSPSDTYPLWSFTSDKSDGERLWPPPMFEDRPPLSWVGIRYQQLSPVMTLFTVRYWLPVLITAIFAYAPWIGRATRFSLRALLIATTLVAVVLGLVVWAAT